MVTATEETVPSSAESLPEMQRENEIYLERMQCNGVPASSEELRFETRNPSSLGTSMLASGSGMGGSGMGVVEANNVALGKRSPVGELYEHGFDSELSFRIRFQKIGAGLENLGNTCFLNSVLQCLTYTEPFVAYLLSGKHNSTCRNAGFCALCALQDHVMDALQSTGKILRPFHLVKNLRCISSNFRYYRQEDAHEYMVNLLESIHKCCLPNGISSESPSAYEKSQIHKIFGGQLRSQVKCLRCSHCSNNFDPFLDLSLEIMKADSVNNALAHFTDLELLDGGDRLYHCERCNDKVEASKQLTIHKAPRVLAIHLKRFDSSIDGEKLSKKVVYEPTLNLNPFISDPCEGDYKYTLYGVLVHAGCTTSSGHYFCYVRTSAGLWYRLDDNQVTEVSEKTVLSREAYMLFYVRNRKFGVKGAAEVAPKSDFSCPGGNKEIPSLEIKPSTAVYCSVHPKDDGPHIEVVPAMDASLQESVKFEGLFVNNDEKVETKYPNLQITDDEFTYIHQTSPSHEPTKSLPLMDSKLPSDSDNKNGDTNNKMETDQPPSRDDFEEVLWQSNTANDSTLNEAVGTTLLDCQEPCENIITENQLYSSHQTKSKLKKRRKCSSEKPGFFGPGMLFLMSLHLSKKKQMKRKKHHIAFTKKIGEWLVDDPNADSNEPSTSKNFQATVDSSRHRPRMHPHSTNRKSKGKNGINRSMFYSSEEVSSVMVNHAEETDILKQSSVVRCDDQNSQVMQMNELQSNSKRNIGDVLDENQEDYEEHKRKKAKKHGQCFGVVEQKPFQETASFNAQQKRKIKLDFVRCDDQNSQVMQMNELQPNSKRNIGCVLDENQEDYEEHKRKKAKKHGQCFEVVEQKPFQGTASFNAQQKRKIKLDCKIPKNQPSRRLT